MDGGPDDDQGQALHQVDQEYGPGGGEAAHFNYPYFRVRLD